MKISVISDLHADDNGYEQVLEALLTELAVRGSEVLLIAGDVSSYYKTTLKFIGELRSAAKIPVIWVAGNHDLWDFKNEGLTVDDIKNLYSADRGFLRSSVDLAKNFRLVGNTGWYDYSFADLKFDYEELALKTNKNRTWQDGNYIKMNRSDADEHDMQLRGLRREVAALEQDCKKGILMTHMVSHKSLTVKATEGVNINWEYFNGFLGSYELCALAASPGIKHVICGHVHYRKRFFDSGKEYLCCCLGTEFEFKLFGVNGGVAANINRAMQDFFVDEKLRSCIKFFN